MSDPQEIWQKSADRREPTLVGYSCSTCGRIFRTREFVELNEGHPPEEWALASEVAAQCCVCLTDGCWAHADRRTKGAYCDACNWYHRWDYLWRCIGYCVRLGVANEVVWKVIEGELDYGHHMNRLHAFMEGREYGGCHCGHD